MSTAAPTKPMQSPTAESWLFDLTGMDCGDCARTIEAGVRRLPGVNDAQVNFGSATLRVVPDQTLLTPGLIISAVSQAGYRAQPRSSRATSDARWWRERRLIEIAVGGLLWCAGFAIERSGFSTLAFAVPYLAAMVVAGYPVARAALFSLRARRADMNLLMTVAAAGAIPLGDWEEGASVLVLFAIGLLLQSRTIDRTRKAIQALERLAPDEANVRRGGHEIRLPVTAVDVGDVVVVRPGERVPIDGDVVNGASEIDQSAITGESVPVIVEGGDTVFAGSMNGSGAIDVQATSTIEHSAVSGIVRMVETAQSSRAPAQAAVDRFAAIYTPAVVTGAFLIAMGGALVTGETRDWIFRGLVLLVVACPCALVISTPVALVSAIGSAARKGVMFKSGLALEALASVKTFAFDKTGTLTQGRPLVTGVVSLGWQDQGEVLALAAAIESGANHPIARAIVAAANERNICIPEASQFRSIPGRGASGTVDDVVISVGSPRNRGDLPDDLRARLTERESEGEAVILVDADERPIGLISLVDRTRSSAHGVIERLRRMDATSVILSGDSAGVAARIGHEVAVDDVRAELMPADKVAAIQDLAGHGGVAMVGDGINDAPALAAADVGIAMGVAGSDIAVEAADVALIADDLTQIPVALGLARSAMSIIRQNIAAALAVKVLFILLTIAGVTNLWLAVLADMGTSLLVTANALRLLRISPPRVR